MRRPATPSTLGSHGGVARTDGFILSDFLLYVGDKADSLEGVIIILEVSKYAKGNEYREIKALEEHLHMNWDIVSSIIFDLCISSTPPEMRAVGYTLDLQRGPTAPKGVSLRARARRTPPTWMRRTRPLW